MFRDRGRQGAREVPFEGSPENRAECPRCCRRTRIRSASQGVPRSGVADLLTRVLTCALRTAGDAAGGASKRRPPEFRYTTLDEGDGRLA